MSATITPPHIQGAHRPGIQAHSVLLSPLQVTLQYVRARKAPSAVRQLWYLLERSLIKQRRQWTWWAVPPPLVDIVLLLGAGLILGFINSGCYDLAAVPQQVGGELVNQAL